MLQIDIAVAAAVAALIVFAGWEYDQRKLDAATTAALDVKLSTQAAVLTQLQAGIDASNAAVSAVAASAAVNARHGSVVRQRVATMGKNDATIESWLDGALPVNGCMLDDTCTDGTGAVGTVSSAAATVHSAGSGAVGYRP